MGDLSGERDWTDVRDVVRAYWLALEHGVSGAVYNIGCGVRRSVGEMLDLLLTMTDAWMEVRQDPARLRACPEPGRRAVRCESLAGR